MIAAVRHGEIDKIIVYRLDRISRSLNDFSRIWDILKEHGAEFVSVNEKFDTSTPVGRAMVFIIMVFAQLERETIAERVKDNYYQRVKRGTYPGGKAPFGFKLIRINLNSHTVSTIEPDSNIETVKTMFNDYAFSNVSLGKIAKKLVEDGVPGIERKTWDNVSISRILHNPAYVKADADIYYYYKSKGLIMYNDISDYTGQKGLLVCGKRDHNLNKYNNLKDQLLALSLHDGVIDSRTFLACQRKLDNNRQLKNTGSGKHTWLSGLIKCGRCGYSLRVVSGRKGQLYFYCSGKSNLHICDAVHHEQIEDVENYVGKKLQNEIDRLSKLPAPEENQPDHNEEKIKVAKIDEQISNLMDRLEEANEITMRYINTRISELDEKRSKLLNIINSAPLKPMFKFNNCNFKALDFDGKKAVSQALIDYVSVLDGNVTVEFK